MSTIIDALRVSPLLTSGDRVLIACSGGADSLALLHALHTLRDELQLAGIAAAHLHHGLRGTDADKDCQFVQDFCAAHGIACVIGHADVSALARAHKMSIETAARDARYAFLDEAVLSSGMDKIALAHTAEDQAETVLLHILRGTGLDGLRGIPARRGPYIRPLLEIMRADVEQYCAAQGLIPCQDATNWDTESSSRSRVRHKLIPVLEEDYNPAVRMALRRLSHTAARDADFLQDAANKALAECVTERSEDKLTLNTNSLRSLHSALARRVLRAAILEVRGTAEGVTFEHIEALCAALELQETMGVTLPAPIRCEVNVGGKRVTVRLPSISPHSVDTCLAIPVPGEAALGVWTLRAEIVTAPQKMSDDPFIACLSLESIDTPSLIVRTVQAGDRIAPLGMHGHTQKVMSILANAKVSPAERHALPVIADRMGLLWIAGHTLAERARLLPETQCALRLHALHGSNNDF